MKYLSYDNNYWVLDIEADGLDPTKIWCVCLRNLITGEEKQFYDRDLFRSFLVDDYILIGHNIISYDVPSLNRLWETNIDLSRCVDTLVLSYLYNPALDGGHSLEAWGQRLKFPKGEFSDWTVFSQKMVDYCIQDVRLTEKVYKALIKKMKGIGFSELSCKIEHDIRIVIDEQQRHGFWFDQKRATDFLQHLRGKQSDLTEQIQRLFPPVSKLVKTGTFKFTKTGGLPAFIEKARDRYHVTLDFDRLEYAYYENQEFNIGSPKQRVERLLALGWEPQKFTAKGFPKVDEDALVLFAESSGRPEVGAIAEWLVLQGRSSMVETWLNNLGQDSRIHGRVNTCGATTRRMTHSNPNTANIPSGAKAKYGHECRSFWGVQPNKDLVLVGYDAAGLETAGLCHYLNNKSATDILLRPKPEDIHTSNAKRLTEVLGWPVDREWGAKTSWYAWLYGAYPPKLGSIVKGTAEDGEKVIDTFFRNVPGLKGLIDGIQYEWKSNSGRLQTIDGGYVLCPSLNAALNYKIQSAGAIVMKYTSIILREETRKQKLVWNKVGDIHDEGQGEAEERLVYLNGEGIKRHPVGDLAVDCISRAGRDLGFKVALTGDYKVGTSWDQTH